MGCLVEITDTGIEVDIHKFDFRERAVHYLTVGRGLTYDRQDSWGFSEIVFYRGANGQRASLRKKGGYWSAAFWQEGSTQ